MSATAIQKQTTTMAKAEYISWEDFQKEYLVREDGYTYEWLDGKVEKTPNSMDKKQLYILLNLMNYFYSLKFSKKLDGSLISEADLHFLKNHRRPDICWLTDEQIGLLAEDANEVPALIMEVISTNDMMNRVAAKMQDYRAAGVQVVWHIFPEHQQVHVYSGKNLDKMLVCSDDAICSAAPVLPAFQIKVNTIFEKPVSKKAVEK